MQLDRRPQLKATPTCAAALQLITELECESILRRLYPDPAPGAPAEQDAQGEQGTPPPAGVPLP